MRNISTGKIISQNGNFHEFVRNIFTCLNFGSILKNIPKSFLKRVQILVSNEIRKIKKRSKISGPFFYKTANFAQKRRNLAFCENLIVHVEMCDKTGDFGTDYTPLVVYTPLTMSANELSREYTLQEECRYWFETRRRK